MKYDDISNNLKMDLRTWPHQFTKNGNTVQVGEMSDGSKDPIFAVPMICIHCKVRYLNGKDRQPPQPCPARNKNREMKRILS